MGRIFDSVWDVVKTMPVLHTKMLNEGEFVEGKS
jgi:hypothetical protein